MQDRRDGKQAVLQSRIQNGRVPKPPEIKDQSTVRAQAIGAGNGRKGDTGSARPGCEADKCHRCGLNVGMA